MSTNHPMVSLYSRASSNPTTINNITSIAMPLNSHPRIYSAAAGGLLFTMEFLFKPEPSMIHQE